MTFDPQRKLADYEIFIDAPYDQLVHDSTRFWNISGFGIDASAAGVELRVGTIDTILIGGVAFGTPPGLQEGDPVDDGATFKLYKSYEDILKSPFEHGTYFVVAFGQSLAGLAAGAPVTYRGIQLGRVERILMKEMTAGGIEGSGEDIPVLIYLEPGRLSLPDSEASVEALRKTIENAVATGLRATLQTGNLLTGRKLINFDYFSNVEAAQFGQFDAWTTVPTTETGVGEIQEQVSTLLAKLNDLPLERTINGANTTLDNTAVMMSNLNEGITSLNKILASDGTQALPGELASTLAELRSVLDGLSQDAELYQDANASLTSLDRTLENLNRLARKLSERPNSLLFSSPSEEDPVPEARQ
jgi:paraquat-inducible protein B